MSPITTRTGTTHVAVNVARYTPEALVRLGRMGRELRLVDQILSVAVDTLTICDDGPAPAWTTLDGDHVSFAMKYMPNPGTQLEVAVWLGTNAHELGHVLFSPRRYSPLMQRVIEGDQVFMRGMADLHNILEDQRQERLLLARFGAWRAYLTAALGHHLVADSKGAWLLMAGRTWLPASVRARARASFVDAHDEAMAAEVADLIGDYQRLTDPGETEADVAWGILDRLYHLIDHLPRLKNRCQVSEGGEPDTGEPGRAAPKTADEADADTPEGESAPEGETSPATDDTPEGEGEGEGEGSSVQPADQPADSGKPSTKPAKGSGRGQAPKWDTKEAKKELAEGATEQLGEKATAEDLGSVLEALDYGSGADSGVEGTPAQGDIEAATDGARRLHHQVGDALLDLKDQAEAGWLKRTDSGRLNIGRLANPRADLDTLYDRFEPGQLDSTEIEMVLLLDVSGSMLGHRTDLAEATWAMRQALDDIDGTATVLTYSDGAHHVLAEPGERPDDRMMVPAAGGGTQPERALREAYRLLVGSPVRNRLLVIFTDGAWQGDVPACEALIRSAREAGITTVLGHFVDRSSPYASLEVIQPHGCEHAEEITKPQGLADLFRRVAEAKITEAWQ